MQTQRGGLGQESVNKIIIYSVRLSKPDNGGHFQGAHVAFKGSFMFIMGGGTSTVLDGHLNQEVIQCLT